MKIAVVTDDGATICQHFGRAQYYTVVTIENGKVVSKEKRSKAGHHTPGAEHVSHESHGEQHGFDANRFIEVGNGPNVPVADNATEAGRAKNRRTEFQLLN